MWSLRNLDQHFTIEGLLELDKSERDRLGQSRTRDSFPASGSAAAEADATCSALVAALGDSHVSLPKETLVLVPQYFYLLSKISGYFQERKVPEKGGFSEPLFRLASAQRVGRSVCCKPGRSKRPRFRCPRPLIGCLSSQISLKSHFPGVCRGKNVLGTCGLYHVLFHTFCLYRGAFPRLFAFQSVTDLRVSQDKAPNFVSIGC